ncbi:MAG: response regulator transcription factor [Candidatus Methylacidiphilales bacterium]|nr:response regulator transcription factor [Candidatus Methylacidiphilales bacterium]
MRERIRLQVVDDHPAIHAAVLHMADPVRFTVAARARSAGESVRQWKAEPLDAVVLDLSMPGGNGEAVIDFHRRRASGVPILVFSGSADAERLRDCLRRGALGCLPKLAPAEEFNRALDAVARQRRSYRPDCLKEGSADQDRKIKGRGMAGEVSLSPREREVARAVAAGLSNKQIADSLGISPATVNIHRSGMMRKLGLHNAAEVTRYVMARGTVGPVYPRR